MSFNNITNQTIARQDLNSGEVKVTVITDDMPGADALRDVADGYFLTQKEEGELIQIERKAFIVTRCDYDEKHVMEKVLSAGEEHAPEFTHVEFTGGLKNQAMDREQKKLDDAMALVEPVADTLFGKLFDKLASSPLLDKLLSGRSEALETFFVKVQERMDDIQSQVNRQGKVMGELQRYMGGGRVYGGVQHGFGASHPNGGARPDDTWVAGAYRGPSPYVRQPSDTQQPRRVGEPATGFGFRAPTEHEVTTKQESASGGRVMSSGHFPTQAPGLHERSSSVGSMLRDMKELERNVQGTLGESAKLLDLSGTGYGSALESYAFQYVSLNDDERLKEMNALMENVDLLRAWQGLPKEQYEQVAITIDSRLIRLDIQSRELLRQLITTYGSNTEAIESHMKELIQARLNEATMCVEHLMLSYNVK